LGAAAGIAAPIVAFACILLAVAFYSEFSWTNNALSDLGVAKGIAAPLFDFGLCVTGVLGLIFAIFALYAYFGNVAGKAGALVFAAATVALIAIGVFNESFNGTHLAVSAAFFVLAPISLFIITCAFALSHRTRGAVFTVAVGVVAALPWILEFIINYVPNVAIPETISALAVSAWVIALSVRIIRPAKN
jgi:hypothetical membrane protein